MIIRLNSSQIVASLFKNIGIDIPLEKILLVICIISKLTSDSNDYTNFFIKETNLADISISTRKSRLDKDILNKNSKTPNKIYTTPCLPVPANTSIERSESLNDNNVSLCELLATSRLSCKDRRNRDEINRARKLQMVIEKLYLLILQLKRKRFQKNIIKHMNLSN